MPITVSWYDEAQTIVRVDFQNTWTVDQFVTAFAQASELAQARNGVVSVIIDATGNSGVPRDTNLIPHFRTVLGSKLYDYMVFIGGSPFGIALVKIVTRITPNGSSHIFFADSVEEAAKIVHKNRDGAVG